MSRCPAEALMPYLWRAHRELQMPSPQSGVKAGRSVGVNRSWLTETSILRCQAQAQRGGGGGGGDKQDKKEERRDDKKDDKQDRRDDKRDKN